MIVISKFIRKQNRYEHFNYSAKNMYFITFCTYNNAKILSEINTYNKQELPEVKLTELGLLCDQIIKRYNTEYNINIPFYVIMPNHIHLIIDLINSKYNSNQNVSNIVKAIKSISSRTVSKEFLEKYGKNIWQKSFYDRIIRNEIEYYELCKYIQENPLNWKLDKYWVE